MSHIWDMAVIICKSCKQSRLQHGRGLCKPCYQKTFLQTHIEYFQAYRKRPEYKQQRLVYDIKYQLKDNATQKKSEMILTFDSN